MSELLERAHETRNWTSCLFTRNMRFFPLLSIQIWELRAWTLSIHLLIGNSTIQGMMSPFHVTPNDQVQETCSLPHAPVQQVFFRNRSLCKRLIRQKPHRRTRLRVAVLCHTLLAMTHLLHRGGFVCPFFLFSLFFFSKKAWSPCADGGGAQCVSFGNESS